MLSTDSTRIAMVWDVGPSRPISVPAVRPPSASLMLVAIASTRASMGVTDCWGFGLGGRGTTIGALPQHTTGGMWAGSVPGTDESARNQICRAQLVREPTRTPDADPI